MGSFASHFKGIEKAKEIAKEVLKLGDDAILEAVSHSGKAKELVESLLEGRYLPAKELLNILILSLRARPLKRLKRALQILETMQQESKKQVR